MREIKFRAYSPTTKRIYKPFYPLSNQYHNECKLSEPWPEHYVFMQFTGLLDKNGKEIYEGDIVSYMGNDHQVRWDQAMASFQIDASSAVSDQEAGVDLTQSIVIGNIYENPELLK